MEAGACWVNANALCEGYTAFKDRRKFRYPYSRFLGGKGLELLGEKLQVLNFKLDLVLLQLTFYENVCGQDL
jgi:hypothetical protein